MPTQQEKRKERIDKAVQIAKQWKETDEELIKYLAVALGLSTKTVRYEYMNIIEYYRQHNWQIEKL